MAPPRPHPDWALVVAFLADLDTPLFDFRT